MANKKKSKLKYKVTAYKNSEALITEVALWLYEKQKEKIAISN